jgi:hypothetical protein
MPSPMIGILRALDQLVVQGRQVCTDSGEGRAGAGSFRSGAAQSDQSATVRCCLAAWA